MLSQPVLAIFYGSASCCWQVVLRQQRVDGRPSEAHEIPPRSWEVDGELRRERCWSSGTDDEGQRQRVNIQDLRQARPVGLSERPCEMQWGRIQWRIQNMISSGRLLFLSDAAYIRCGGEVSE